MEIVLYEKSPIERERMENLIRKEILTRHRMTEFIVSTENPEAVLRYVEKSSAVTIYLLGDGAGVYQLAKVIGKKKNISYIVFISRRLKEWMYQVDQQTLTTVFIPKGRLLPEMLMETIDWIAADLPDDDCLVLKRYREIIKIPYKNIYSIETVPHLQKLMITYENGVYIGARLLIDIQPKLDGRFQRINRYAIVNMEHVRRKAYGTFMLANGVVFRYSKRYITKEVLNKWKL